MILPIPPHKGEKEYLDLNIGSYDEVVSNLRFIRLANKYLGSTKALLYHLARAVQRLQNLQQLTVLDIATGSADIPIAIVNWARKKNLNIQICGVDINDKVIKFAAQQVKDYPEIRIEKCDALKDDFLFAGYDILICSTFFHHLGFGQASELLGKMIDTCRHAVIVNDLVRSWFAYLGIWALTRLITRNKLTLNDGPLSVLNAFTLEEFAKMIDSCNFVGSVDVGIYSHFPYRACIVAEKDGHEYN